jgi:proteasome lid subunit RPN8/RPN11
MFDNLHEAMLAHARQMYPRAACGAVFQDEPVYRPVTEVADVSRETFHIDAAVLRRMAGRHGALLAIVLVHPSPEGEEAPPLLFTPSAAEMRAQALLAVPFGVVVCDSIRPYPPFWFGDQCPIPTLLNRPFRHGVTDCYSVIRDWYRTHRDILLPDFPRDWNWWVEGMDMYREGFRQAGFEPIDEGDMRVGDGVLFRMRSDVPNHGAIVLDDEWMLHHPASVKPFDIMRMSCRQRIERWRRHAAVWVRHTKPASKQDPDSNDAPSCG